MPDSHSTSDLSQGESSPGAHSLQVGEGGPNKHTSARSSSTTLQSCSSYAAAASSVASVTLEAPRLSISPTADLSDDTRPSDTKVARHTKTNLELSHVLSGQYDLSALLPTSTFSNTHFRNAAQSHVDINSAHWDDVSEISPHVAHTGGRQSEAGFRTSPSMLQVAGGTYEEALSETTLSEEQRVHQACKRISLALTKKHGVLQESASAGIVDFAACSEAGAASGSHQALLEAEDDVLDVEEEGCGHLSGGGNQEQNDKLMATYCFQEVRSISLSGKEVCKKEIGSDIEGLVC